MAVTGAFHTAFPNRPPPKKVCLFSIGSPVESYRRPLKLL